MLQTKTVLDAKFKKLLALMLIGGADGGGINPLSRMAFIDGGNAGNENGSIAEPFKSPVSWAASIPSSTAVDNIIPRVGYVTPGTYAAALTLPAYRSTTMRSPTPQVAGGALTLHNTVLAGGKNPAASMVVGFDNVSFTSFTVTDDATAPPTTITCSFDEATALFTTGAVDVSGATHVAAFEMLHAAIGGAYISTTGAGGALLSMVSSEVLGAITAPSVQAFDSTFNSPTMSLGANTSNLIGSIFESACAISGVVGTLVQMDGATMRTFTETGGTIGANVKVLVSGGFSGAAYDGANLTDADVSVSLNGTGATAGFTQGGNHYTLPAATLGAPRTLTLKTGGGELPGDTIRISRQDATANAYTIHNNAGATIGTLVASVEGFFEAVFKGGDWQMTAIS